MADDIEKFVKLMFSTMVDTTLNLSEKVVSQSSYITVLQNLMLLCSILIPIFGFEV